jgi:hypothetical protein
MIFPGGPFDALGDRHWRIKHTAGTVALETSANRTAWSPIHVFPTTTSFATARVQFELTASAAALALFDNFEHVTQDCPALDLPAFARDSFSGPAGTLLDHKDDRGASWSRITNNTNEAQIVSANGGTVTHGAGAEQMGYVNDSPPASADYDVEVDYFPRTFANATGGILARGAGGTGGTAYVFLLQTTMGVANATPRLFRLQDGGLTSLCNVAAIPMVANSRHRMRLRVRGAKISGFLDGQLVCSATDAFLTAPGFAGLSLTGASDNLTGVHLENFLATDADR